MGSKKRKRLEATVAAIQRRWGTKALSRGERELRPPAAVPHISTSFPSLDKALAETGGIAIEAALTHHCAHLDGVQLSLTQLSRPEPAFAPLDLADRPRLNGAGEQDVHAGAYDALLGGG